MVQDRSAKMKDSMDPVQLLAILWRKKALILGTTIVLTLLGTALSFFMRPEYTASSEVLLDLRRPAVTHVTETQAAVGNTQAGDAATIRSEVDVISSPVLLKRVITDLDLMANPYFTRTSALRKLVKRRMAEILPAEMMEWLFRPEDLSHLSPEAREQRLMAAAVQRLQENLGIYNDQGRSYTIRVSYTSEDPDLAAQVVNAVTQQYVSSQRETKDRKIQETNHWLQVKLADLK